MIDEWHLGDLFFLSGIEGKNFGLDKFTNHVGFLVLGFIVSAHDHFGDQTEQYTLYAGQEEHDGEQGQGRFDKRFFRISPERFMEEFIIQHECKSGEREQDGIQPNPAKEVNRALGISLLKSDQDEVENDIPGPSDSVFGHSSGSGAVIDHHFSDFPTLP